MPRKIHEIAKEITQEWKNINYAAKPYLEAMLKLETVNDNYGMDDGKSIVLYFLSNARSFKGEAARRIKLELSKMVGIIK